MSPTSDSVITERHRLQLSAQCQEWLSVARSTAAINRTRAEAAIAALYGLLNTPAPKVLWCQSPWQMVAMAAVLQKGIDRSLHAELVKEPPADTTIRFRLSEVSLETLWNNLWKQLDGQLSPEQAAQLKGQGLKDVFAVPAAARSQDESWWNHLPFGLPPADTREKPKLSTWANFMMTAAGAEADLQKQLHGVAEMRLAKDAGFQQLKQQFATEFRQLQQPERNNRTWMGETQMNTLGLPAIDAVGQIRQEALSNLVLPLFADLSFTPEFSATNVFRATVAAVSGGGLEELTKEFYGAEHQLAMSFAFSAGIAQSFSWWLPWALDWLPFYEYLCREVKEFPVGPSNVRRLKVFLDLAREATGYLMYQGICFVCDRPLVIKQDEFGRLHSENGSAIAFGDGFRLHSWHGSTVPAWIIETPHRITVKTIEREINAEVRRVLIDRFGISRFLDESGAVAVHEDEFGILYRKELPGDEPLVMVKVLNTTPEPDGTRRTYFLRVPPDITTAKAAVAWTFELDPKEYQPKKES